MRGERTFAIALAIWVCITVSPSMAGPAVGTRFEVQRVSESESQSSKGSSSSFDRDTITVAVAAVTPEGMELIYDLDDTATAEDRAREWTLPARILIPENGSMPRLLNSRDLEARLDPWLKSAGWTRSNCGKWIFTWNAFRIECDPQSVLGMVEAFRLQPAELRDGAPFTLSGAGGPTLLRRGPDSEGRSVYLAELELDGQSFRQQLAQNDVVVADITGKPVSLADALAARASMKVSGTISVRLESGTDGLVDKRIVVTRIDLEEADGSIETRSTTQTLTRKTLAIRKN